MSSLECSQTKDTQQDKQHNNFDRHMEFLLNNPVSEQCTEYSHILHFKSQHALKLCKVKEQPKAYFL